MSTRHAIVTALELVLKIRDGATADRKASYLAMAITLDGHRQVLGRWFQESEGSKLTSRSIDGPWSANVR